MKEKKSHGMKQHSASGWKVFTRTTFFQAKDKDDMMSWIGIIQKNNNPDEDVSLCLKTFEFQLLRYLNSCLYHEQLGAWIRAQFSSLVSISLWQSSACQGGQCYRVLIYLCNQQRLIYIQGIQAASKTQNRSRITATMTW